MGWFYFQNHLQNSGSPVIFQRHLSVIFMRTPEKIYYPGQWLKTCKKTSKKCKDWPAHQMETSFLGEGLTAQRFTAESGVVGKPGLQICSAMNYSLFAPVLCLPDGFPGWFCDSGTGLEMQNWLWVKEMSADNEWTRENTICCQYIKHFFAHHKIPSDLSS